MLRVLCGVWMDKRKFSQYKKNRKYISCAATDSWCYLFCYSLSNKMAPSLSKRESSSPNFELNYDLLPKVSFQIGTGAGTHTQYSFYRKWMQLTFQFYKVKVYTSVCHVHKPWHCVNENAIFIEQATSSCFMRIVDKAINRNSFYRRMPWIPQEIVLCVPCISCQACDVYKQSHF